MAVDLPREMMQSRKHVLSSGQIGQRGTLSVCGHAWMGNPMIRSIDKRPLRGQTAPEEPRGKCDEPCCCSCAAHPIDDMGGTSHRHTYIYTCKHANLHFRLDQLFQSVAFAWFRGEKGQKLKEITARHSADIQILTQQHPHLTIGTVSKLQHSRSFIPV